MAERGLHGLLLFRQESMYYLTGYDTFGYCFFQCLYLGADGRLVLLTRAPDMRQARHRPVIDGIRVWIDEQRAMTHGQSVRVTPSGCERLSRVPLELVVK